jgi:predicted PurR-regulated permease PerM
MGRGRLHAQLYTDSRPNDRHRDIRAGGLLTADTLWRALLPAGLYLAIHIIEGETVTPMLLARRFTLNPVLVVMAIIFWHWMWGVPGAILAVPMLAITKIVCDRISTLAAFGPFLEG